MQQTRSRPRRTSPSTARVATPTGFVSPKLEGRADPRKGGHGVFAREPIEKQETLVVWGGEVVTAHQLLLLPQARRHRLCLQVEADLFLMTTREGPADWVNHSCNPNGGMAGQIVLVAMRDIAPGEEICFDYAMTDSYPYDEFDCHCGSPGCRARITAEDWRLPALQKRYRGYFAPHIERFIHRSTMETPSRLNGSRRLHSSSREARRSSDEAMDRVGLDDQVNG